MNETVSRPSALHASRNQTASSLARVVATCSSASSSFLAVYAQPPCTLTSPRPCSAHPLLAMKTTAAAAKNRVTAPFEPLPFSGLLFVLERIGHHSKSDEKA